VSTAPADHAREAEASRLHDVRNSLSVLRLIVEGLRDGVVDARVDMRIVDQMLPHVQLVSDLLDEEVRSDETRCGAPSGRPVQIGPLLEQWSDAMRAKADQRSVDLRVVIAPALPLVVCRRGQVARALLSLLDNAIRHSPAGEAVVMRAVAQRGGVQVQVDDCGPGLPEERHDAPIDALWPARPGGRGLSIARTIVEAHGGALWATALPRGSSVRFYLPTTARAGA